MAMLEPLPNGVSQIIMRDGIRSLRNQHANPKPPDDKQRGKRGKPDSSGRRDLKAVGRGEGVNFPITRGGNYPSTLI